MEHPHIARTPRQSDHNRILYKQRKQEHEHHVLRNDKSNNQTNRGAPVSIVNVNEDFTLLPLPLQGRVPSMLVPQVRLKLPGGLVPTPTHKHNDAIQSEVKEAHASRSSTPQLEPGEKSKRLKPLGG
jgi:hypothetical protein